MSANEEPGWEDAFDEMFKAEGGTPEVKGPAPEEKVEADSQDDAEAAHEEAEEDEPKAPPYHRFAEVSRERTAFKREAEELKKQIEDLQNQTPQVYRPEAQEDEDEIDKILRELDEDDTSAPTKALESRLATLEQNRAADLFEKELDAALGEFKGVDRQRLIDKCVVTEGKTPLKDLAKELSLQKATVSSEAVATFLDEHPDIKQAYLDKKEGKAPETAPKLKGKGRKKTKVDQTDPHKDESDAAYLARQMAAAGF